MKELKNATRPLESHPTDLPGRQQSDSQNLRIIMEFLYYEHIVAPKVSCVLRVDFRCRTTKFYVQKDAARKELTIARQERGEVVVVGVRF